MSRDTGDHINGPTASPAIDAEICTKSQWSVRRYKEVEIRLSITYAITHSQRSRVVNLCLRDEASRVGEGYRRACVGGKSDDTQDSAFLIHRPILQ